jgi:anthocyanidin reductase
VLIKPAVEGTINICKACAKAKVKRLVITSSSAAIKDQLDPNIKILTEENWSVVENNPNITAYGKSKTLAE